MPITFNTVLQGAGFNLNEVRLLRHQDQRAERGRTPYELWRDEGSKFDLYQSHQRTVRRSDFVNSFGSTYWASFVGTPRKETLFVGIWLVQNVCVLDKDTPKPHMDGVDVAGSCDVYDLIPDERLGDLIGRLYIDWGEGYRSWVQHAERRDKTITELRTVFQEQDFPGFLDFISPLSKLDGLPKAWISVLKSSGGVYLLTCPKTKEQYVGSATSEEGFWNRWQDYAQNGHGGNVALKGRAASDYQISILEVAGSSSTREDVLKMEALWKTKLQGREMGLNRN